jgi:hypothetical protein
MVNIMYHSEIESAIEHAINALSLAKLALSKSALPVFNESDTLRKLDHVEPVHGDAGARALAMLEDVTRRVDALKAADAGRLDYEAQHPRKTVRFEAGR